MDFRGTPSDDVIDQERQAIPAGPIYGLEGNDRITVTTGLGIGGQGDDVIVAGVLAATVAYWDSPTGVVVDLAAGSAQDGFGTIDRLIGIRSVQGSNFDDILRGGDADEFFYGGRGNNRIEGGKGVDTVNYYFEKSTATDIHYDVASDTFTVVKRFTSGDSGTDTLSGIERVQFTGEGADNVTIYRDQYVGNFRTGAAYQLSFLAGVGLTQSRTGDFNGDGHLDVVVVTQAGTGTTPAPTYALLGDGKGGLRNGTADLFGHTPMKVIGGGRTLIADFNSDGRSDIFQLDFGNDAVPFPGGTNSLYLSSTTSGQLLDVSGVLPQRPDLNHGGSTGDINGDGHIDILVNTLDEGNLLLINDGTGRFVEDSSLLAQNGARETSTFSGIVDVNGDFAPDLILGTWNGNLHSTSSKILLNDGKGTFTPAKSIVLPSSGVPSEIVLDVDTLDLNGDLFPDLMLSITNGGDADTFYRLDYIQLLVNDGTGNFRDETAVRLPQDRVSGSPGWYMSLTPVDLNNDGFSDILAESAGNDVTSKVYLNRGDGTFNLDWESRAGERAQAADMDGDGMRDLVVTGETGVVTVMFNKISNGHIYQANFGGDALVGSVGNDVYHPRDGNHTFNGESGLDVAMIPGARSDYELSRDRAMITLSAGTGVTRLQEVERIVFSDQAIAFDLGGIAGQAYRLYQAAFGRTPDQAGLGFWISTMDRGMGLDEVGDYFVSSIEFVSKYGAIDNDVLVSAVYRNVLHREPDLEGLVFWKTYLGQGGTQAGLMTYFSESAENQAQTLDAIDEGIVYLPVY
jgi:hypothetical protein